MIRRVGRFGLPALLIAALALAGCAVGPGGAGTGTAGADGRSTPSADGTTTSGADGSTTSGSGGTTSSAATGGDTPAAGGHTPNGGSRVPSADLPIIGTTWWYTQLINNGLPMRLPADPDAWIRFADGTLTINGTKARELGGGPLTCPTLRVPATVSNGALVFGKDAAKVPDANNICGARVDISAGVKLSAGGGELRMSVDEGMNKSVRIFSATKPVPPAVPGTVDLSFLAPPTDRTVREQLANPLAGKEFLATEIAGRTMVRPGITMSFGTDQVGLVPGCNYGSAGYTVEGSTITFTPGSWTAAGCGGLVGEQESWLVEFTADTAQFQLSGPTLRITAHGQTMVLTEKPAEGKPQPTTEHRPAPSVAPTSKAVPEMLMSTIDEIVTPRGVQPLPAMEKGDFWSQPPNLTIETGAIVVDVGCGQLWSNVTGTFPKLTAGSYDGTWLLQCPPKRSALAAALRYVLSGPLTIARDGAFLTITGRDGLVVNAHSGY